MKRLYSILFLFLFVFVHFVGQGQTIRRDRDAGSFPPSENPDEYNPFSEGVDSLDNRPRDTTQFLATNTDTINFRKVLRRVDLNLELYAPTLSLDSVHLYQPAFVSEEPTINLGNNGTALLPLTKRFTYIDDFNLGFDTRKDYLFDDEDVDYYVAQRPYSRLKYVTGAERENNFEFDITKNLGRGLNLGLQYERLVSEGFYDNQTIDIRNTALHGWYRGNKKHFNSMAHFISNKYLNGTNGGIDEFTTTTTGDQLYYTDYYGSEDFDQRRNIPVKLEEAERKYEGSKFNWQNSYDFGKNVTVKINDSINDILIVPRFRVQHTLNISNSFDNFHSELLETEYFSNTYIADSLTTADTLDYRNISNEFRIKWLGNKLGDSSKLIRQNFLADAFTRYSSIEIDQLDQTNDNYTDLVVGGNFRSNPLDSAKVIYKAQGAYHLTDYRQGDYLVRGEAGFDLNFTGKVVGFLEFINQEQAYTSNRMYQSHYRFDNDLDKLNSRVIGGIYNHDKLKLNATVRFANSSNILYFDENRQPQISGDAVSYVFANVNKTFQIKNFFVDADVYYQNSSDTDAIRVPDLITKGDIYYKGPLFKNKVIGRMGFNGFYHSEYNQLNYDPSLDQFFLAGDHDAADNNNPQINFYTNFELSRARVFLRLDNLTSFLHEKPIINAYLYPQHDFAFRAGINWVFVN